MRMNLISSSLLLGAFASCLTGQAVAANSNKTVHLSVTSREGNASSPLLYGTMFEVSPLLSGKFIMGLANWLSGNGPLWYSNNLIPKNWTATKIKIYKKTGDGGIHGQLLRNNGFQGSNPDLTAYKAIGDVDIKVDGKNPVSQAINASLLVSVNHNATGVVGFANHGYAGIPVHEAMYNTSFWMRGKYDGTVTVQLVGVKNGTIYAEHNLTVRSEKERFKQFRGSFRSSGAPDGDNDWRILFDARKVLDGSVNFGLVELFPPTYHGRCVSCMHLISGGLNG